MGLKINARLICFYSLIVKHTSAKKEQVYVKNNIRMMKWNMKNRIKLNDRFSYSIINVKKKWNHYKYDTNTECQRSCLPLRMCFGLHLPLPPPTCPVSSHLSPPLVWGTLHAPFGNRSRRLHLLQMSFHKHFPRHVHGRGFSCSHMCLCAAGCTACGSRVCF